MPLYVNVGGSWTEVTAPSVRANGEYVDLTSIHVNVGGTWMTAWEYAKIVWDEDTYLMLEDTPTSEINSAIPKMADNSVLMFSDGEWTLTEPIRITRSNIHIKGSKSLTKLKLNGSFPKEGVIDVRGVSGSELTNVTIRGILVDGSKDAGSQSYGICSEYVGTETEKGVTVEDCMIKNNSTHGIYLSYSSNNTVTGNTIQNNSDDGIRLYYSSNSTITGNTIQNNSSDGIILSHSSNNTVTGNTIENNTNVGIRLAASSNNNTITGNTVQNNTGSGMYLYNSSNSTITGNTIQNNDDYGIRLYISPNNTITGNMIQNNTNHGIYLYSSSNNTTITGNTIQNNSSDGIRLAHSSNNIVNGNIVQGQTTNITDTASGNLISINQSL